MDVLEIESFKVNKMISKWFYVVRSFQTCSHLYLSISRNSYMYDIQYFLFINCFDPLAQPPSANIFAISLMQNAASPETYISFTLQNSLISWT